MNIFYITADDIKSVAKDIDVKITKKHIAQILKEYPEAQKEDPTGTWDLVIENQIYNMLDK